MNLAYLGEQIDIHGGGNDLIFPHHENEIAQSESFTGKEFARYWIHNGMLQLMGEKMSKSLGNLVTIEEFLSKHPADSLRMLVLNSGYRNPLSYSEEILSQVEKGIERLRGGLKEQLPGADGASVECLNNLAEKMAAVKAAFIEAMDDDFNTAGALGQLFDFVKVINQARAEGATDEQLRPAQNMLLELTSVLGLTLETEKAGSTEVDGLVNLLIEVRKDLRANKMWAISDKIRDRLEELGIVLEDGKEGTSWHWR
jgi:cysteinyl-tRNA synthetase